MFTENRNTNAFTLVEIIVVLVIISVSAVILIPRVANGIESAKYREAITDLVTFLRKTHLNAIEGRKDIYVTIDFDENFLKRDDDKLYLLPPNIILKPVDPDDDTAIYSFFYNGRGSGPEIQLIGANEREATIYVDSLSGLAKCDFK